MGNQMSCPRCKSRNVECRERPHRHLCLDCGYDGTTPTIVTCDSCGGQKWGPMSPEVPNLCGDCMEATS